MAKIQNIEEWWEEVAPLNYWNRVAEYYKQTSKSSFMDWYIGIYPEKFKILKAKWEELKGDIDGNKRF